MRTKIRWGGSSKDVGRRTLKHGQLRSEVRHGFLVGIQTKVETMYTGTLIRDLMATVERAELGLQQQQRFADEMELQRLFELQSPSMWSEQVLAGAA